MKASTIRLTILSASAGGLSASAFIVPEYLRVRAILSIPPVTLPFRAALTDNAVVTGIAFVSAVILGGLVPVLLLRLQPLWAKLAAGLALLFLSLLFGPLPVYWYVYRDAAPAVHINIPSLYRLAPLAAAAAAVLLCILVVHLCPFWSRHRSHRREA